MSQNPINLGLRFFLEIAALVAIGYWAWHQTAGLIRFLLVLGLPLIAAAAWGTFRVPGDASASGQAPVPVPGLVRLLLEAALFASAIWGLAGAGQPSLALIFALVLLAHYALSYDRILWLLKR